MIRGVYAAILDFLFPARCPECGCYSDRQGQWCQTCLEKIIACRRLPVPVPAYCVLPQVDALARYQGSIKRLIHRFKYHGDDIALAYLQTFLQQAMQTLPVFSVDIVVPVPLYFVKEQQRGFNQTEKIFHPWAQTNGFLWQAVLVRKRPTLPQYELNRCQRQENMKDAFAVQDKGIIRGRDILLVDDIFTTGATMVSCAKILHEAGAKKIIGIVLASDS
ncbi:MAG: ComF family protein [Selenomonadaceae bacterium]